MSSANRAALEESVALLREGFVVSGVVQGVGFRPFVYRLAESLGVSGFVQNRSGAVLIEAEAPRSALSAFAARLRREAPPLARIDGIRQYELSPQREARFRILGSAQDAGATPLVTPDVASCGRCLAELGDPADRRYRYPFINCTDCGPRFTIVEQAPYDRERTTMRGFTLCDACRDEYEDPHSRRFHAQPNACPRCGPTLEFAGTRGAGALPAAIDALRAGRLLAIKGIGGYHLACLADDPAAVSELRRRKGRDAKPFALMVRDLEACDAIALLSAAERLQLLSPERPIVLLRRRAESALADAVAPKSPLVGVMLPYTPLHQLLLAELERPLVMTSGNATQEPIAFEDEDAKQRLASIADGFLGHDRPIRLRCDDSVQRVLASGPLIHRRARGAAPSPLRLEQALSRPILALGAQSNATFALGRERHVFVSHHLGDLDHHAALRAYADAVTHYEKLFGIEPELVVHDLHPDYASTRFALELCEQRGLPRRAVQHHHAHVAACMLEHGLTEPVLGVALDGSGLGEDGSIWGGEFLLCDRQKARRVAHFRPTPMPGGESAVREPWRMAAAYVRAADAPLDLLAAHGAELGRVLTLLDKGAFCPPSSGVGRLFDAVSALLGVCSKATYDGQPAIELEWAASGIEPDGEYPFELVREKPDAPCVVDVDPLVQSLVQDVLAGTQTGLVARRFHSTLVAIVAATCERLRDEHGSNRVVLAGGVFNNALLLGELEALLPARGFELFRPRAYPPGDGGLCLGQLAIAAEEG